MGELSLLALVCALALVAIFAARNRWIFKAHEARALDGSPVLQLELRVARRQATPPGWRLYCSVILARGQDKVTGDRVMGTDRARSSSEQAAIPYGQPPAGVL